MSETIEVDSIEALRALPVTMATVVVRGFPDGGKALTPNEVDKWLSPPNPPAE